MDAPYEIKFRAKDVIREMFRDPLAPFEPIIERALENERDRERSRCAGIAEAYSSDVVAERIREAGK